MDVALGVLAPAFAGPVDLWGWTLKAVAKKAAKTSLGRKQVVILFDDWLYKKVPKITGYMGKFLQPIRNAVYRAAGATVPNVYATGMQKTLPYIFKKAKNDSVAKKIDFLMNFTSAGSIIAYLLAIGDTRKGDTYVSLPY